MNKTATETTNEYIKEHADIKSCLKKGLINYSSLARLISKELNIEKKTSKEAILIAARRFQERLKQEINYEKKIKNLLANSEIEVKNKVTILILKKNLDLDQIHDIEKFIKKDSGIFYLLEGSAHYSIITQDKYANQFQKFGKNIIVRHENQALINYKSPKDIEYVPGVVAYLTSLFTEHNVNITEIMSFWTDTLFIINNDDANKAMGFLKF